jgi:hypothetical protein
MIHGYHLIWGTYGSGCPTIRVARGLILSIPGSWRGSDGRRNPSTASTWNPKNTPAGETQHAKHSTFRP